MSTTSTKHMPDEIEELREQNEKLRDTLRIGVAVVEDFMKNIRSCVLQDYGALNTFLVESKKDLS